MEHLTTSEIKTKTILGSINFYGKSKKFCDECIGLLVKYDFDLNFLEIQLNFEETDFLSFSEYVWKDNEKMLTFIKHMYPEHIVPFSLDSLTQQNLITQKVDSYSSLSDICQKYCYYDEYRKKLIIKLNIPDDYVLDYGLYTNFYDSVYLRLMPGSRWRFLDRVNGG